MRTHTQRCGLHWQPFTAVPRDCDLTLLQLCPKLDYKGADGADDPAVPSCLLAARLSRRAFFAFMRALHSFTTTSPRQFRLLHEKARRRFTEQLRYL